MEIGEGDEEDYYYYEDDPENPEYGMQYAQEAETIGYEEEEEIDLDAIEAALARSVEI
eukprot:GDKH01015536.1.p2 GENE.GDKH01015536.1~~GDKH01015536.1.p2  ORF type:complete len:58 (+),score=17.83 GDKH01015536.1:10-183(+)